MALSDKLKAFGEFYGQSKTGVGQGSGFVTQIGLEYLLAHEKGLRQQRLLGE